MVKPDSLTGGGGREGTDGGRDWLVCTDDNEGVDILEGTPVEPVADTGLADAGGAGHAFPQLS